jgi:hypothetical protein
MYLMPERGKTFGLDKGLGADAPFGRLGRVFL